MGQKIDAGKAALREFVSAGQGHAVLSGPKFVEVDHLALSKRCSRGGRFILGVVSLRGFFKTNRPATPKNYSVILAELQFPVRAGLRARCGSAAVRTAPPQEQLFLTK
jgi:hypothetical protein